MTKTANDQGPQHYKRGTIEVWDFIRDQDLNYFLGNAIKYVCRAGYKDSKSDDLKKAIHYLTKELEHMQQQSEPQHAFVPHPVFSPVHQWSTGTDIQDSDGISVPFTNGARARTFRAVMGFPNGTPLNSNARTLQARLITEEYGEFLGSDYGTENELKEIGDLVFVCYQYAALMGYDLDEALRRIYISNMSKLGEDGNPVRREDGKILKGPNYQPPDLSDLV